MKVFKWLVIIVVAVGLLLMGAWQILKQNTKKASPESTVLFEQGEAEVEIFYNQPSKRGRRIFGDLVPYGQVWRTGANEATTFETNANLDIMGQTLEAGHYTLWTIPGKTSWKVIWNDKDYMWGLNFEGKAAREEAYDALVVEVPVTELSREVETFTISIEKSNPNLLRMEWEETALLIPFRILEIPKK